IKLIWGKAAVRFCIAVACGIVDPGPMISSRVRCCRVEDGERLAVYYWVGIPILPACFDESVGSRVSAGLVLLILPHRQGQYFRAAVAAASGSRAGGRSMVSGPS